MGDIEGTLSSKQCLFSAANEQYGLFTAAQARRCGVTWDMLSDGAKAGRFVRLRRGLYRFRDYPSSSREEVVAAWLAVGKEVAVVSHESALELHDLSDVVPYYVHLTVPRSIRNHPKLAGVKIHTTTRGLSSREIVKREGLPVTSETRTIVDAAESGTGPEQIEMAVYQALRRGATSADALMAAAEGRSRRTQLLIKTAIEITNS